MMPRRRISGAGDEWSAEAALVTSASEAQPHPHLPEVGVVAFKVKKAKRILHYAMLLLISSCPLMT